MQEAERFLGKKPGSTLMEPQQQEEAAPQAVPSPKGLGKEIAMEDADDFFKNLADANEKQKADEAAAVVAAAAVASQLDALPSVTAGGSSDWSEGPELLIKQSLLVGNLPAAVECCFKSGKLAEGLLLASGGGTTLWTRARDEFLRLQNDVFLTTVGNIMTNDFENLVGNSNLGNWMETLAIIATYAGDQYPGLCENLAERLEKEKCDTRSAVICYICAKNFSKTVQIWSNTCIASFGSKKLALADLVEKMAVLQEATKFNQTDPLFNSKLTQYAEILANSGRLTAAMRYLCLLRDDTSSSILRDRIYNSAPVNMSQMFGRAPPCPFEPITDVRILAPQTQVPAHQPAVSHQPVAQQPAHHMAPGGPGVMNQGNMPPRPAYPTPTPNMPVAGAYTAPGPSHAPAPQAPQPYAPPAPSLGPAPRMNTGMPPAPNVSQPQPGPTPGVPGFGGMQQQAQPQPVHRNQPMQPQPMQPQPMQPQPMQPQPQPMQPQPMQPLGSSGVLPPGQVPGMNPNVGGGGMGVPPSNPAVAGGMGGGMGGPPALPMATTAPARPAAPEKPAGEPMAPQDLENCKSVFAMLLDMSSQDGNAKKREDIAKRLEDLYSKLGSGAMKTATSQKVLQIVKSVEAQDYTTAKNLHKELANTDWDTNRNWLVGVQRLIPNR